MSNNPQAKTATTPTFTPEIAAFAGCDGTSAIDALTCVLQRAQAVCTLLQSDFDGDESSMSKQTVQGALWSIEGYLDQAKALADVVIDDELAGRAELAAKLGAQL